MNTPITKELLEKYLNGQCTIDECELVEQWYASFENESPLFEDDQSLEAMELQMDTKAAIDEKIAATKLVYLHEPIEEEQDVIALETRRGLITFPRVAAAVFILLAAGFCFLFSHPSKQKLVAKVSSSVPHHKKEIVPGGNKAVLTLADGSTIILDSTGSGALAVQGNTKVIKSADGQLIYDASGSNKNQQVGYNTLSTPRAAQYQLILPDGTKVWLNAASSIRYPTAFVGKERVVEITGEAYFEVAKVKTLNTEPGSVRKSTPMPFRVKVKNMEVEVLGTHFNVNAYDEEQTINTTLLEGSVKLRKGGKEVLIKPGERAKLNTSGSFKVEEANVNEVVAWKNGLFQFENASLNTVLRQIARWYDVEVVYERDVSADRFQGKLFRNTDINQLLKILELSGAQFKIEGKKIIVQ